MPQETARRLEGFVADAPEREQSIVACNNEHYCGGRTTTESRPRKCGAFCLSRSAKTRRRYWRWQVPSRRPATLMRFSIMMPANHVAAVREVIRASVAIGLEAADACALAISDLATFAERPNLNRAQEHVAPSRYRRNSGSFTKRASLWQGSRLARRIQSTMQPWKNSPNNRNQASCA